MGEKKKDVHLRQELSKIKNMYCHLLQICYRLYIDYRIQPEPPKLSRFEMQEQRFYFEPLPNGLTPHLNYLKLLKQFKHKNYQRKNNIASSTYTNEYNVKCGLLSLGLVPVFK